jgi:hypothetical protein
MHCDVEIGSSCMPAVGRRNKVFFLMSNAERRSKNIEVGFRIKT